MAGGIDSQDLEWIRMANQAPMLFPERLFILVKRQRKDYRRPTRSEFEDGYATSSAHGRVKVEEIIQLVFVRQVTFISG